MNEELKIIIKAVTDEAKKGIAEVKKELEKVESTSKKTGKEVDAALKGFAKGAAVAVSAITALTAAMAKLGKSAQEINKGFSKMQSSFINAGSSAKEATKYYKELFGILGEHDRTVETGQSLARITTDSSALGDYKNIMAGAMSMYGDGYNSEALAENIAETIAAGKVTGDLERVLVEAGISADGFNATLQQITSTEERELLIRSTLNGVLGNAGKQYIAANQATIAYNESQANLNVTLAAAASYTLPLLTALNTLGSTLLTVLAPALEVVAVYLTAFIELIIEAIQWVGSFFGMFGSKTEQATADVAGYNAAMQNYLSSLGGYFGGTNANLEDSLDNINAIKKATMGFDELNVVSKPTSSPSIGGGSIGGGGLGNIPTAPNPSDFGIGGTNTSLDGLREDIDLAKEKLEGILTLVGLIAAGLATWKIVSFINEIQNCKKLVDGMDDGGFFKKLMGEKAEERLETIKQKMLTIGGVVMIVAGAFLLVKGYADAWANGIDWANFTEILVGIGLVVGGLAMAVSPLAAAFATVVGGIAMLIIGIKDLVENGYSMEAVIMVAVGAIALLVGGIWAMNSALLANPITWVVVAIMALVAAFVVLWNECEGFRNFWKAIWDGIVTAFEATVAWFAQAGRDIAGFFKDCWKSIKTVFSPVGEFFSGVWRGIQKAFGSVGSWFKNVFTDAWEGVKNVFSTGGKIFSGIKEGLGDVFVTVVNGIITGLNIIIAAPFKTINGILNKIRAIEFLNISPFKKLWKKDLLPVPEIPMLATGGIVSSATMAVIGERGREAVLPLENNTGWMDTLAQKIAAMQGGATPSKIVLMIDGKELGYATIGSINDITRQTGKLQLNVI